MDAPTCVVAKPTTKPVREINRQRNVYRRCRIALYSHDTMGLGHMRRNLHIARALSESPIKPTILLICGAKELGHFEFPPDTDCVVLPAYQKCSDGKYSARHLYIYSEELFTLRSNIIKSSLETFKPDVLIVDNVPLGAMGELEPSLRYLKCFLNTRCILGLRDIQDNTTYSKVHFLAAGKAYRDWYDSIWIYGDPNIYDRVTESQFSADVKSKARFTGYLGRTQPETLTSQSPSETGISSKPKIINLCLVGGGQDGEKLATAFARAVVPDMHVNIIIMGPYMPEPTQQRLREISNVKANMRVMEFVAEPMPLLSSADNIIAMGGYNTICEILSFNKRALIVPRTKPRNEQWIRAKKLQDLGLIDVLHPDELSTEKLSAWISSPGKTLCKASQVVNLDGLKNIANFICDYARY